MDFNHSYVTVGCRILVPRLYIEYSLHISLSQVVAYFSADITACQAKPHPCHRRCHPRPQSPAAAHPSPTRPAPSSASPPSHAAPAPPQVKDTHTRRQPTKHWLFRVACRPRPAARADEGFARAPRGASHVPCRQSGLGPQEPEGFGPLTSQSPWPLADRTGHTHTQHTHNTHTDS